MKIEADKMPEKEESFRLESVLVRESFFKGTVITSLIGAGVFIAGDYFNYKSLDEVLSLIGAVTFGTGVVLGTFSHYSIKDQIH